MKTALFISPHLDDVAFSCGGTLARLAAENWRTILCTVFTKSVAEPKGFALACQLDKNLAPEVDYMKLRRAEDFCAARTLNAGEVLHLSFAEAPHRGYESAAELFAGIKESDSVWLPVAEHFALLDKTHAPDVIFAPQGLGSHVDHRQTIRAARESLSAEKILWYRDTPYAIRKPEAQASDLLPVDSSETAFDISLHLDQKIAACAAYHSQINFQFGGAQEMDVALRRFHHRETQRGGENFRAAEVFSAPPAKTKIW